ncbi:putative ABC transporter permease protein [Acinetobacter sp. NBRC 100985]|nr:putative ABC transporter permease protein [Acinetobacter sp. NBRC 100985]
MMNYILKRMLLMIPTLFFILLINFMIVQVAPGGPVEQAIQQIQNAQGLGTDGNNSAHLSDLAQYQGARGLSPEMLEKIKVQYGFDRPAHERFWLMLKGYLSFDFGTSFFKDKPVTQLLYEKLPVTLSLGLWSTFLIYLIAIPLGIKKARNNGFYLINRLRCYLL